MGKRMSFGKVIKNKLKNLSMFLISTGHEQLIGL